MGILKIDAKEMASQLAHQRTYERMINIGLIDSEEDMFIHDEEKRVYSEPADYQYRIYYDSYLDFIKSQEII